MSWPGVSAASPVPEAPSLQAAAAEGTLETTITTLLDGRSRVTHRLVADDASIELKLPSGTSIPPGSRVRVAGQQSGDDTLDVSSFEVLEPPPEPLIDPDPRDPRRIATILVYWDNAPLTNAEARDRMFLGANSTNVFYGENSYGKEIMAGNVFGPYQIPEPGWCNTTEIADAGMAAFAAAGHSKLEYVQFMFHFEGGLGCSFSGSATLGSPNTTAIRSFYNNSFGCVVRNQELAHNYGLVHSRRFTCNGGGQNCLPPVSIPADYPGNLEYGDPYDPMGNGCHHLNAVHKTKMEWLEGCNVVTATSNGTFNLSPLERPCNGTQTIRFPTADGRYYWLEYRAPVGEFDSNLQGVLLHVGTETAGAPFLVYAGDQGRFYQGDSWSSPDGEVSFTVTSMTTDNVVIDLTFPNGGGDGNGPVCLDGTDPVMDGGAIGLIECTEPFPLDTQPPTVEITYPAPDQMFQVGDSFTATALGMDDRIITELELYIDGQPTHKVFENPGSWEVENVPEGAYELGVVAWDGPNQGLSEPIMIYVEPAGATTTGATTGATGTTGGGSSTDGSSAGTSTSAGTTSDGGSSGEDTDSGGATSDSGGCACRLDRGQDPVAPLGGLMLLVAARRGRRRQMP